MADEFNISDQPEQAGPKSVEVPGDIADGSEGELLSWDAAGVAALVPKSGTAGFVLTENAAGVPTFQAGGAGATTFLALTDTPGSYAGSVGRRVRVNTGGTALVFDSNPTLARWVANDAIFPFTSGIAIPAGTVNRNNHPLITFDDTVNESVIFSGIMDRAYSFTQSMICDIHWVAATAVVGAVKWDVQLESLGEGGQDIDLDGFPIGVTGTQTTAGTAGVLTYTGLTMSNAQADSVLPGDSMRVRITRDATDASDTMVGDAQILAVELRMT